MSSESNLNSTIARNLKFLREEQGLSVEDLAKLTHIGHSTINEIELNKKKRPVNPDYIPLFAKALRVDPDVLTESNQEIQEKFKLLRASMMGKDYGVETEQMADELVSITCGRGPKERAEAFLRRGTLFYYRGAYSEALPNYERALSLSSCMQHEEMEHQARHNLASAHMMLGAYDKVEALIKNDLELVKHPQKRARDFFLLGRANLKLKKWDDAQNHILLAIKTMGEAEQNDDAFLARCHQILGDIFRSQEDFIAASRESEVALELSIACGDELCQIYSQKTLALCQYDDGQAEAASEKFRLVKKQIQQHEDFPESELLIVDFYIARCECDYQGMKAALLALEQHEIEPRDFAIMLESTARIAMAKGLTQDSQLLYEKAIKLLLK